MDADIKRRKVRKSKLKRQLPFYIMALPGVIYLLINNYIPMFGIIIAFKKIDFSKGILHSPWNGLNNFRFLFATKDAFVITRNTILYNISFFVIGTICAIALAILLNELHRMKKLYQTLILLPYLMSWVIISYLFFTFLSGETGLINTRILNLLGLKSVNWYQEKEYWPFIIVFAYLWKNVGYNMIIYLSSIVSINTDYFEAAKIDGASKWQQITQIMLPLLKPTVITLFIISMGQVFRSDFGLFYQLPRNSGALFSVTRTLDVYIYQALMQNSDYAMSSAASFYQAIVGFVLILGANALVRKYEKESAIF